MQAVIMAGGKGTRLREVTNDLIPKSLVKINNKTLLDYSVENAIKNGVSNIIICTGFLGQKINEHVKKTNYPVTVFVSQEKEELGTAGPLQLISGILENEFFVLYSDVYSTINLRKMIEFHKKKEADVTIAVHKSDHPQDSTVVVCDKNGKYLDMIQKPGDRWQKYGNITQTSLYLMKKDVLSFIKPGLKQDFETDIFPKMLKQKLRIYGYFTEEYTKDMGTPDRFNKLTNKLQSENLRK